MTREIKNEFPACPEDFVLTEELKQEFNLSIAKYLGESRDTSYVLYLIMNSFSRLCFFFVLVCHEIPIENLDILPRLYRKCPRIQALPWSKG